MAENPINRKIRLAEILLNSQHTTGKPKGVLLSGPGGIGKTYAIRKIYKEHINGEPVAFDGTPRSFIDYVKENKDGYIILDEGVDDFFFNPDYIFTLRKLLDTNEPRVISWRTRSKSDEPPFMVTACVVIASNLNFEPSTWSQRFWHAYIQPLLTRLTGNHIRFNISQKDLLLYTLDLAPTILADIKLHDKATGFTRELTERQKNDIIDHFRDNFNYYHDKSPRVITQMGNLRISAGWDDRNWEALRSEALRDFVIEKKREQEKVEYLKASADKKLDDKWQRPTVTPASDAPAKPKLGPVARSSRPRPSRSATRSGPPKTELLPKLELPAHLKRKD